VDLDIVFTVRGEHERKIGALFVTSHIRVEPPLNGWRACAGAGSAIKTVVVLASVEPTQSAVCLVAVDMVMAVPCG
jgi:hypothetical protein